MVMCEIKCRRGLTLKKTNLSGDLLQAVFCSQGTRLNFDRLPLRTTRRAEEALRISKELYINMFENALICYQSLDENGNLRMVNQAWVDTLGYRKEEVLGKWFGTFLAPEYVEAFRQRFPNFKTAGKTQSEFAVIHKNGLRRLVSLKSSIGYKADDSFERTHCIFQDITEQKRVEEALRQSEAKYRQIIDNISDVVWTADLNLNLTCISPSIEKMVDEAVDFTFINPLKKSLLQNL